MTYQVLAQKYRPQAFDDVVGQEAVTRTLKNSIARGRLANAYLFCGPRGVGKTSVARLLAKTLNCEKAPEKSPCNKCSSCLEISQGNNIDVLEIDGASNRGIDEIRALRENVKFSPSKGKFKIYIIDEVHMLTPEAFNALLKTLEEPPAHVKFVFATTEPHRVLPTILSRCQRFDFKKIPPGMIFDRVKGIAKKESIDIDDKAAILIARSADGSLRDSLVILDQMVSFSGKKIMPDDVMELLGMVHKDRILALSGAVIDNDPEKATRTLDELINDGKDPVFVTNTLISHFRDLMVLKTTGEPTSDMALAEDELKALKEQLAKLSLEEILYILQNLSHCLNLMKGTMFARAPLEITLVRMTKRGAILSLPEALAKLEKMGGCREETTGAGFSGGGAVKPASSESSYQAPVRNYPSDGNGSDPDSEEDAENNELGSGDLAATKMNWKAVLKHVRDKKMSVFTFLSVATPTEFSRKRVVLGFGKSYQFNKEALETESNRKVVEEALTRVMGNPPRLEFTILETPEEAGEKADNRFRETKSKEEMKPVIEKALDVFGGQLLRNHMED